MRPRHSMMAMLMGSLFSNMGGAVNGLLHHAAGDAIPSLRSMMTNPGTASKGSQRFHGKGTKFHAQMVKIRTKKRQRGRPAACKL